MCLSVQDGINVTEILKEIILKDVYKDDYNAITIPLLFEDVTYEQAIKALTDIFEKELFN